MTPAQPILFYDGVCHFCDATVRFVLEHERGPIVYFMPLQASEAESLLEPFGITNRDLSSMLVLEGTRLHRESDAAILLATQLRAPWRQLGLLLGLLPGGIRNAAYRAVGKRRYRWWGRTELCITPPASSRHRFLGSAS